MFASPTQDDPHQPIILLVGPDGRGHWLVQEQGGALEGSFMSREAALNFARWERHAYPVARIVVAADPLTPRIAA